MKDNFDLTRFNKKLAGMPEVGMKGDLTAIQSLLEKRKSLGLSRAKIARLLDCPEMTLIRWEKNEYKPSPVYEKKIYRLLVLIEQLQAKSHKKG